MNMAQKSPLQKSGRFQNQSCVVYQMLLPALPSGEGADFLQAVETAFLSFLEQESGREEKEVRFGGIRFREKDGVFFCFAAFSPFSRRVYRPVFSLRLREDGSILALDRLKKDPFAGTEPDGSFHPQSP